MSSLRQSQAAASERPLLRGWVDIRLRRWVVPVRWWSLSSSGRVSLEALGGGREEGLTIHFFALAEDGDGG